MKTIKNQEEKQVKIIEEHGKQWAKSSELIEDMILIMKNRPLLLKQREISNKLLDRRRDEILELNKRNNYDDLTFHFKVKV